MQDFGDYMDDQVPDDYYDEYGNPANGDPNLFPDFNYAGR